MSSDAKILKYSKFVSMDYMLGLDLETVLGLAYNDLRNELAKSFIENMETSKEYIVKFDRTTNKDQPRAVYRIDGYLSMKPVQHGHWVSDSTTFFYGTKKIERGDAVPILDGSPVCSCYCSVCSEWLVGSDEYAAFGNYCPNCGAKMDEVTG